MYNPTSLPADTQICQRGNPGCPVWQVKRAKAARLGVAR